jgi:hypothetical protein
MARETINGISVPIPGTGEPADFIGDLRRIATDLSASIASGRGTAYMNLVGKPDGTLPAEGLTDSGHPFTRTSFSDSPGYIVSDQALSAVSGLAYLNVGPLPSEVTDFRMSLKWDDNGFANSQPAVMIVSPTTFISPTGTLADAGAHVLLYRDRWIYQKRSAAGVATELGRYYYTAPLAFGAYHTVRMTWDGGQPTMHGPDGSSIRIGAAPDTEVVSWWDRYAAIETVAAASENKVHIREWSVGTGVPAPVARASASSITAPIASAQLTKEPATASTALTSSFVIIETLNITVPSSKAIAVWAMPNISAAAGDTVYGRVDAAGHPTSIFQTAILEGTAFAGAVPFGAICDLSPFTVGTSVAINVRLSASGAGTATVRRQSSTPQRRTPVVITPVEATFPA